jgi:hypothetical protein
VFVVLPRGNYVVKVTRSDLVRYQDHTAVLTLFLSCKGNGRICKSALQFHIFDPDREKEQRERARLLDLAAACGVDELEDSDQMHGIQFRLTIWNVEPMRWSCRPLNDAGVWARWPAGRVCIPWRIMSSWAPAMAMDPMQLSGRSARRMCADVMLYVASTNSCMVEMVSGKKSKGVGSEVQETTPQAEQASAQARKPRRHGKAAGAASAAPGQPNGNGNSNPRTRGLRPPWKKGEVPNPAGRPRGSRHKLSEKFILALHDSFEEHGAAVIDAVIQDNLGEYLRIIASVVPKQFGVEEGSQDCFLSLWRAVSDGTIGKAA